ncbi:MAG TPA: ATP synthase subunit I [Terriglobales bacterium]|nr:ATP synthase subunit I [Terriglobales bacterium]
MSVVESTPAAEDFYAGAYARILRFMLGVGTVVALALEIALGWRVSLGFMLGCAIASVNFYWLKRVVSALADRLTQSGSRESSRGVVLRFLLRYLLIALGVYVIFRSSSVSLNGLLAGLFLPVAAIGCEAAYEVYVALRRGI